MTAGSSVKVWGVANRSSNSRLLAIGFAVLVVGVVLVLVIIRNTDDDPAEPSQAATDQEAGTEEPTESATPLTPEQLSSARLPLPLDVPEGTEAMAVRVDFMRSIAAVPSPGDLVNLYRMPEPTDRDDAEAEADPDQPVAPTVGLPDPGPDSEQVLTEIEVLAVTGPLPAANDGTLTVVLAVDEDDVPALLPVARDRALWLTLLPDADGADADGDDADATGEGTGDDGDEDSGDDGASATGADDAEDL